MAVPNTGGVLRTSIADMQVGDYIACNYSTINGFYQIGVVNTEIPLAGVTYSASQNNYGTFYFTKVDKGLLISDRVVSNTISWDQLNALEYIQGKANSLGNKSGSIRSLGGGNSYASATGTSDTADAGLGAWPTDNEWDTYIAKKDYGTGAGRDDIWHFNAGSFVQETRNGNTSRVYRGKSMANNLGFILYDHTNAAFGFRPVFEYQEVTP